MISRRLAELHGGRLWVESEPGVGSAFHFTVAAAAAPADTVLPRPGQTAPGFAARHPARLLLVEDNPVNQRVAVRTLQKLGYAPVVASHGAEALALLHQSAFDLVLMDVEMPVLDGLAATRRLRAELPAGQQPFVVALTAHTLGDRLAEFNAAGFDAVLAKPLRLEALTGVLARSPGPRPVPAV